MGMWNLFMASCTRKLKTCRRFKTNSCYNFLKDCEIVKMHMNQVLICCMMGGEDVHCTISFFEFSGMVWQCKNSCNINKVNKK